MSNISGNQGPQGLDRYNPLYKAEGTSDAPATRKAAFGGHDVQMAPKGSISWLLRKMFDSVAYFFGGSNKAQSGSGFEKQTVHVATQKFNSAEVTRNEIDENPFKEASKIGAEAADSMKAAAEKADSAFSAKTSPELTALNDYRKASDQFELARTDYINAKNEANKNPNDPGLQAVAEKKNQDLGVATEQLDKSKSRLVEFGMHVQKDGSVEQEGKVILKKN